MKNILGINSHHTDSSACLLIDGILVAAVEEERFTRIKHWSGFPGHSIKYCLEHAGLSINDIDCIAINNNSSQNILKKLSYVLSNRISLKLLIERIFIRRRRASVIDEIRSKFPECTSDICVKNIEHHYSHLASAYFASPFKNSAVVSIDGFGDFASTAWGIGCNGKLKLEEKIYFPHSMGIFYMAITQFLGFKHWGDEYKVMGLSPYGKPIYLDKMRNLVRIFPDGKFELNLKFFTHHLSGNEKITENGQTEVANLFTNKLIQLLGMPRSIGEDLSEFHKDIASSAQALYEEVFLNLLNSVHRKYQVENLALAGGCAMNSVANGKIILMTKFKKVYVQPAAGDAGGAVGAAMAVASEYKEDYKNIMSHAYWGPKYSNEEIEKIIFSCSQIKLGDYSYKNLEEYDLNPLIAQYLANGEIIGWFQGRCEWGPRSLGNRSILADPRGNNTKEIINSKIKRRESFRPFAPSIKIENVGEWFEVIDDVPFMTQVYQIKKDKRFMIPAVTHVDGSGRLQTVSSSENQKYWKLIDEFHRITGVPILLNTSFNENEPVVCSPKEALDCFLRTDMDVLVMENWVIRRRNKKTHVN